MNGPQGPARATLGAHQRLRSQRHFRRVYQRGRRAAGAWMTVVVLPTPSGVGARLGVSVGKDHGGAVRRNKLKRLLREAFRLERHRLPTIDVVLIPRVRADRFPLAELRQELRALVQRAMDGPAGQRRRADRR